jgi:hypothetical protein
MQTWWLRVVCIAESVPFTLHIVTIIRNSRNDYLRFTREKSPAKVSFLTWRAFPWKTFDAVVACLMIASCIASSVTSEIVLSRKPILGVTSVMSFPVIALPTFQCQQGRRLFYERFRIGESWGQRSGVKTKRPATFVLNVAIRFSEALHDVISARSSWIWIRALRSLSSALNTLTEWFDILIEIYKKVPRLVVNGVGKKSVIEPLSLAPPICCALLTFPLCLSNDPTL